MRIHTHTYITMKDGMTYNAHDKESVVGAGLA